MKRFLIFLAALFSVSITLNTAHATQYYISEDAWASPLYFNIPLTLSADIFSLDSPTGEGSSIDDRGRFKIYLKRAAFPIKTPHCQVEWLTVAMNETRPTLPEKSRKEYLDEKISLYKALAAISAQHTGTQQVILSFEGEVYAKKPLEVGVKSGCEIIFNQGLDHYDPNPGIPAEKHPHYKTINIDKPR